MKILPMQQPWASLVVEGPKVTETRDRHTSERGPVLILATRTIVPYADARYAWDFLAGWRGLSIDDAPMLVQTETRGMVIGGVHIIDSVRSKDCRGVPMTGWAQRGTHVDVGETQVHLGDLGPGRRVWLLADAVRFDHGVVCRGMPGWFDAPPDVEREAMLRWNGALQPSAHAPILIPCEGAGCPPNYEPRGSGRRIGACSMCGSYRYLDADGNLTGHDRQDVLAMLDRGDFG